jgi:hypothetical protein
MPKIISEEDADYLVNGLNNLILSGRGTDKDPVDPPHYKGKNIEVIDVIEAFDLDFCLGNAVKYILRHKNKDNPLIDLKKCRWYVDRAIKRLEDREAETTERDS